MNLVIIKGNLTRDPELKYTPGGSPVAEFAVAVSETWTDNAGNKREDVCFLDCFAWGKTAEIIAKYFTKGKPILITGKLKQDNWEDKTTGQKRSKLRVQVDRFEFCDRAASSNADKSVRSHGPDEKPDAPTPNGGVSDDDIPF